PQVAGVGLDEFQAVEQGLVVETAELLVARWPRFRVAREDRGFLRLIRDPHTDLLVGARALAPEAGDLMTELGMVMKHRIKVKELAETLSPYLTLSEGIQRAAAKFYP
ncbi:MAG: mercuric reductase, partial [Kiritimatiellia bacterium]